VGNKFYKNNKSIPRNSLRFPRKFPEKFPVPPRTIHQIKSPTAAELELSNHESIAPTRNHSPSSLQLNWLCRGQK